jgi:hypothetical protein
MLIHRTNSNKNGGVAKTAIEKEKIMTKKKKIFSCGSESEIWYPYL